MRLSWLGAFKAWTSINHGAPRPRGSPAATKVLMQLVERAKHERGKLKRGGGYNSISN